MLYFFPYSSMIYASAFENHESSNGEEPSCTTPPPNTPPPPVSGYAVAAGAQQNHVDSAPLSPPLSAPSRMVNHVSSAVTSTPSSISRPSQLFVNSTQQSEQSNHLSGETNGNILKSTRRSQERLLELHFIIRLRTNVNVAEMCSLL